MGVYGWSARSLLLVDLLQFYVASRPQEHKAPALLCFRWLPFSWSNHSAASCKSLLSRSPLLYAHRCWRRCTSSPFNWTERQKNLAFECKWCMSIRVVTLFSQIDPGGLTSLPLMETELLMLAVIWSVGGETTSPSPHTVVASIRSFAAPPTLCISTPAL